MKKWIFTVLFFIIYNTITAQPYCVYYNYGTLGTNTNIYLYTASSSHVINAGCIGLADFDHIIKFTPNLVGKYEIVVNNGSILSTCWSCPGNITFALRETNGLCDYNNFTCLIPDSSSYLGGLIYYTIDVPVAGVTYDLLLIPLDSGVLGSIDVTINCAAPTNLNAVIGADSALVTFDCNCPNSTYLEYGTKGFLPGSDSSAGGGNVIANITSPFSLTGLIPNTNYDIYLRSNCSGSFSKNRLISFRSLNDCINPPIIDCSSYIEYKNNEGAIGTYPNPGHWVNYGCGYTDNNSIEKIFQFTPSVSGMHSILYYGGLGWSLPNATLYYKQLGGACDESGWICLADVYQTGQPNIINWGPLNAGTTYLLLIDGIYNYFMWSWKYFRIECPNVCSYPTIYLFNKSATSGTINSCSNCDINSILEYGPSGFTPGTDTSSGIGGTVIQNVTFPFTINNLLPGTTYDVYVRNNCGTSTGISVNSNLVTFTTQTCLFQTTITASGPTTICNNSLVNLSGNYGLGVSYQWQINGNDIPGATNSLYQANITGDYSLLVTDSCGTNTSNIITVSVDSNPSSYINALGPTSFCQGGYVTLNANNGTGLSHQWQLNGNNITGAISLNYYATTAGNYTVVTSNSCGSSTSNVISINISNAPGSAGPILGPTSFCRHSTQSFSVSPVTGATNYVWAVPHQAQIISGQGTNSVVVSFKVKQGDITVKPANQCGSGPLSVLPVQVVKCFRANNAVMRTNAENHINIFPNPSYSAFNLNVTGDLSTVSLIIFDYAGRIVELHENVIANNNFTFGNDLAPGFYFVEISSGEDKEVFKVVKIK